MKRAGPTADYPFLDSFYSRKKTSCEDDSVLERDAPPQNTRWTLRGWTLDSEGEILEIERTLGDEYRTWH